MIFTRKRLHFCTPLLTCFALLSLSSATPICAQESFVSTSETDQWMVVTDVFQGEQKTAVETHKIAFRNGVYYDFPTRPQQPWTIFDLPAGRVILLNRAAQTRTSVPTENLIQLAARAESEITDLAQRARYAMDATASQTGHLRFTVAHTAIHYDVQAMPVSDAAIAVQYGRFVDWVCRLNIARPRGVPPFARMKLNALMTSHRVIPKETSVTLTRHLGSERIPATIRLRSTTTIHPDIETELDSQIEEAQSMQVVFQEIPWDQFEY